MKKSVLYEIVTALSRKEMKDLNKWLQSPAHNQRKDVVQLFNYLTRPVEPPADEYYAKEQVWKSVFPKQPFDDAFLRQVMYFLMKAIEDYLVFAEIKKNELQFQLSLTKIYRQKNLDKAYRQSHRLSSDLLEKQPLRNTYYLLQKFLLEQELSEQMGGRQAVGGASTNLQASADAHELWFIAEKLQISNAMLTHHKIYPKANYQTGMLDQVLQYVANSEITEPIVVLYYYAYMATTHPDHEPYFDQFEVKILSEETEKIVSRDELREFYRSALNYCTAKVNQGNLSYCRRALRIYDKGSENKILFENNQTTRYIFGNAVAFALKIQDFEWPLQFIQNFQQYLDEKERNSIVNFNLSRLYFEKGDYAKAQTLLREFEYDDLLFNIIAKTMLLKIYYEESELDAFESLLESMRTYLQRKDALDAGRKAAYKNTISLMKKLLHLNPYSKPQREKLRELIIATHPLMERDWLLSKVK